MIQWNTDPQQNITFRNGCKFKDFPSIFFCFFVCFLLLLFSILAPCLLHVHKLNWSWCCSNVHKALISVSFPRPSSLSVLITASGSWKVLLWHDGTLFFCVPQMAVFVALTTRYCCIHSYTINSVVSVVYLFTVWRLWRVLSDAQSFVCPSGRPCLSDSKLAIC